MATRIVVRWLKFCGLFLMLSHCGQPQPPATVSKPQTSSQASAAIPEPADTSGVDGTRESTPVLKIQQEQSHDYGPCECCGSMSRLVAGLINRDSAAYAGYQVHWTLGQLEKHGAMFYVILGPWGEDAVTADRYAVALQYRNDSEATGFMIVDADETRIAAHPLVGKALRRDEVIGTPLAPEVFDIVDFIWLQDDRIAEVTQAQVP